MQSCKLHVQNGTLHQGACEGLVGIQTVPFLGQERITLKIESEALGTSLSFLIKSHTFVSSY